MFTVPSEKERKHLRGRGVSIPKKEKIWRIHKCNLRGRGEFRKCTLRGRGTYDSLEGTNGTPCSLGEILVSATFVVYEIINSHD